MRHKDYIKDTLKCRGYTHMNYLKAIERTNIDWLGNIPQEDYELKEHIYKTYNPYWITRDLSRRKWFQKDLLNNLKLLSMGDKILTNTTFEPNQRKYFHFTYLRTTFNTIK
jgi:hypothetical protein